MNLVKDAAYVALSCVKALQSVKFSVSCTQISEFSSGDFLNIDENIDIDRMAKTIAHSLSKT